MTYELINGDCIKVMEGMEDGSVDSIVTDPPYGLSFMGKDWDDPSKMAGQIEWGTPGTHTRGYVDVDMVKFQRWTEAWAKEAFRVLKPGGHIISFAGSRTYHRMACAIEDAGFEIRDQIMWLYGTGFPKSLNVSKAIDKAAGHTGEVIGTEVVDVGMQGGNMHAGRQQMKQEREVRALSDTAAPWGGWGTALKPAHEPCVLARKPLIGTVAENVLEHGTGGLNIDGCRVGQDGGTSRGSQAEYPKNPDGTEDRSDNWARTGHEILELRKGRWPANVIFDEEAGAILDEQAPSVGNAFSSERKTDTTGGTGNSWSTSSKNVGDDNGVFDGLSGASKFFYCAKPSKAERNAGLEELEESARTLVGQTQWTNECGDCGRKCPQQDSVCPKCGGELVRESRTAPAAKNHHPTVKPVDLMRYLCRLITPPGGVVLDPFMGSGTTGIAATNEGFRFIGIEMEEDYIDIARRRITHWVEEKEVVIREQRAQRSLFDF